MNNQLSIIDEPYEIKVPCLLVRQPIGNFFIATIDSKSLCQITFADVRRMYAEREFETYLGIQRPLNKSRVKEIQDYVDTVDACFPTAVILAIPARCIEYIAAENCLLLRSSVSNGQDEDDVNSIKIARVLDGQHRIEGLRNFQGPHFDVNVSIFIDMDIESQAYIFSTVNLAQTKVNKSLVYDLFALAKARSPQKTCHRVAVALDSTKGPFHQRIKRLGSATEGRFNETLTQATFVEALLPYLTSNKVADRDLYLRGKRPKKSDDPTLAPIFRNLFLDERDLEITDIIENYFNAVAKRWPQAWNGSGKGSMLNKTNGFRALMRFLKPAYLKFSWELAVVPEEKFASIFAKIGLNNDDFSVDTFPPGSSGEALLLQTLLEQSGLSLNNLRAKN
ncbi:Uncharacterized conserved protein [Janthinobacterium sp. Marseille]|nr:DGQHR domain-containing protein [Janthinobacterium sp. Marseille]ABR91858.1 Uncharacterized conserved protein [Janthinobacterium sp. Marseille]